MRVPVKTGNRKLGTNGLVYRWNIAKLSLGYPAVDCCFLRLLLLWMMANKVDDICNKNKKFPFFLSSRSLSP